MWQAARHGLNEDLISPGGRRVRAGDAVSRLLAHIGPALDTAGDTREITSLVHRLLQQGTGADRQRQSLAEGGIDAVIAMVIDASAMP
ncbi:hypothetical protein [Streptomyces radiopugnans]|uniref:Carboxylate-amine ligase n=2 Tax=Streptomyces TaxID=1883 RepID=A0A1H9JFV4_9ACTN|nr:hypothetical protein [Streptomyces radiopugnans]SEQ85435.1 carboxylate-amine ligase [Streptomyces radiopugnans]